MAIILFIVILLVLIVSHEFGHFIVAKLVGMRVDEFGIGFPPRIFGIKKGETTYSINWLPFGGFVSIFGENYEEDGFSVDQVANDPRSFQSRPKWAQALVLLAGVTMNWLVALVIIVGGFMYGLPVPVSDAPSSARVTDAKLIVTQVLPESPAAHAGLTSGDQLVYLLVGDDVLQSDPLSPVAVTEFVSAHKEDPITIGYRQRDGEVATVEVTPLASVGERPMIGIAMEVVGTAVLPLWSAIVEGVRTTVLLTGAIVKSFVYLIADIFKGQADLSAVSGPVGLVGMVSSASEIGMIYVLTLTAIISLNLAVLNLLPFPALDGGRLLFVIIEKIKGSPISAKVANRANVMGFLLLIILMVVVTVFDILKL